MSGPLTDAVQRFVAELEPVLAGLAEEARMRSGRAGTDVALEASNIAAGFIDSDGLQTDEELWAYVTTFAPHFDTLLQFARPADVRRAGIVTDRKAWLAQPSVLFEILVGQDHRQGTRISWRYYEGAMAIAHAVCALDAHPSHLELEAVDRFRTLLLQRMENWDVPRRGRPALPPSRWPRPAPWRSCWRSSTAWWGWRR